MNFFQTLIRPDREERPDRAEVARAANLLQVGEFQLLQLAYDEWFGREMSKEEADRLFATYMLRDQVPSWARHFARRIFALDAAGALDDRDPAWHRFDVHYGAGVPQGMRRFLTASLVILLAIGGGLWLSIEAVDGANSVSRQILPPYFSDKELTHANQSRSPVP